jgi:hypothetical protein
LFVELNLSAKIIVIYRETNILPIIFRLSNEEKTKNEKDLGKIMATPIIYNL